MGIPTSSTQTIKGYGVATTQCGIWRLALVVLVIFCISIRSKAGNSHHYEFLYGSDVTVSGNERARVLGPIFEHQTSPEGMRFRAVRPFFSTVSDAENDRRLREYLWPAAMVKDLGADRYWRCLNAFGHDFDTTDPQSRWRTTVLPVLFTGRDKSGQGYFAVFPVGGTIHEFLGRDRIVFAAFPLYAYSAVDDVRTHDVLWPIISWSHGDDVSRFRIFPLYGYAENRPEQTKRFVLWPLWTSATYNYPVSKGYAYILFPLFGRMNLSDQQTWMFLPPLFRVTRGEKMNLAYLPWPFIQYASGEVDKLYVWPLWGKKSIAGTDTDSWFALWPIIRGVETRHKGSKVNTFNIVPFLINEKTVADGNESAADPEVEGRYFKLWPVMSYMRQGGDSRFRALDLWPAKDLDQVERNFAPFWTLYSRTRVEAAVENELLWGLWRTRTEAGSDGGGGSREWSALFGLVKYRHDDLQRYCRLLYFLRLGSKTKTLAE